MDSKSTVCAPAGSTGARVDVKFHWITRPGVTVEVTDDPRAAVEGASCVYTDVWASMGQEEEQAERERAFVGFCVDEALMARAARDAIVLHCLPAHRGEEISEGVLEGPQSRVFAEAENRLHAQKALMAMVMG